jgi:hypothetical protein
VTTLLVAALVVGGLGIGAETRAGETPDRPRFFISPTGNGGLSPI